MQMICNMRDSLPHPSNNVLPQQKGFYVYLIRCADNSLYCGWTTDIRLRFYQHATGKGAKYTRAHRPLELYYYEIWADASTARKRECAIKKLSHQEKRQLKNRSYE